MFLKILQSVRMQTNISSNDTHYDPFHMNNPMAGDLCVVFIKPAQKKLLLRYQVNTLHYMEETITKKPFTAKVIKMVKQDDGTIEITLERR